MNEKPQDYREYTGELRPVETVETIMFYYEPLEELITEEDLVVYCWGFNDVALDRPYNKSKPTTEWRYQTKHRRSLGEIVRAWGWYWRLTGARVVYRSGQWCVRWIAYRMDGLWSFGEHRDPRFEQTAANYSTLMEHWKGTAPNPTIVGKEPGKRGER